MGGGSSYISQRNFWLNLSSPASLPSPQARLPLDSVATTLMRLRYSLARQPPRLPSPAGLRAHFRSAGPRAAGWMAPHPPLLCSVIQTWKVNNTLTSSGVCVLLHGYFPEYLALSKRGALDCTSKALSEAYSPGEARVLRPGPFLHREYLQGTN